MFTINSRNIFTLRTPGGDRFTEFVDALIRAEAYSQGIPMSGISTNLRTNLGDGGVDSEVRQAIPTSQTGWLNLPTCWQHKATQFREISDIKSASAWRLIRNRVYIRYPTKLTNIHTNQVSVFIPILPDLI